MDILMPQLGETVAEGKITTWYKSVGDKVVAGDALFEIETDKTSMEVPTTEPGVLTEIRVAAGATVPVGSIVAVLSSGAVAATPAATPIAATTGKSAAAARSDGPAPAARAAFDPANPVRSPERNYGPATLPSGIKVTPVARRLAAESGVDLGGLTGSGPHGHIVAGDVQAAAQRGGAARTAAAAGTRSNGASGAASTAASALLAPALSSAQVKALYGGVAFEEVPLDGMRRTIARRLTEAKQSIPHFYLSADVSMDKLVAVRTELNAQSEGQLKISINDFIIKAVALALQRVPEANAAWAEESVLRFRQSDVAVAVAIEGGLFTPVIRDAAAKSIGALSREMKSLAERAQGRSLKPAEYSGGAITISNLGMYGVREFAAIVNPPQAAILAVGAAERRPVEGPDGSVRFGSVMSLTLSCDHRVIDGALGARLLGAIRTLLESPLLLLA
ncbi:MAG TPA: dihydrolipoamide acetyltransferase family protein [Steroidobacteraceae bacterium]|jgi:pyruvate dehydrogenase E2 component (dihydrolipoamide acetyltransferase)|nr:dihydrolipoamide acetyltransferase family protein [Steroidobacteraceae bacterium]